MTCLRRGCRQFLHCIMKFTMKNGVLSPGDTRESFNCSDGAERVDWLSLSGTTRCLH
jgi:hypothetical protein